MKAAARARKLRSNELSKCAVPFTKQIRCNFHFRVRTLLQWSLEMDEKSLCGISATPKGFATQSRSGSSEICKSQQAKVSAFKLIYVSYNFIKQLFFVSLTRVSTGPRCREKRGTVKSSDQGILWIVRLKRVQNIPKQRLDLNDGLSPGRYLKLQSKQYTA